jgi:hypothetical protein
MPWMIPAAIIGSSLLGSSAASSAASTQANAANNAAELQNQQYQRTREDQAPYREAGYNALTRMQNMAGNVPGKFRFSMEDFVTDPGYNFRLTQGTKAIERSAAARGGLLTGNTGGSLANFGQGLASQEYSNAYNRALTGYNTDVASENQLYNRQAALAGIGQTATNFIGNAGANNAANVGNLMTSGAAAQAAGYMGGANAVSQGVGQYLNYNQGNNLISALRGGGRGGGGSGGANPAGYGTGYDADVYY